MKIKFKKKKKKKKDNDGESEARTRSNLRLPKISSGKLIKIKQKINSKETKKVKV